ncbi:hypothetical protein UCRPC4_g05418 [Phaeomoniella chlamydospora]|uniref:Galactose oxidase kelch beta-propeller n=1 Tax=Phaeomoniella chlamydospora TaxID=158046 RepID=A0A0G2GLK8_PHACM|nr:hypothetical protein UCRPC4_g05418 [Phaeomoniella chlamydospora]
MLFNPRSTAVRALLAFATTGAAIKLPYTPTHILLDDNDGTAWVFAPETSSSQVRLSALDISDTITTSDTPASVVYSLLPFLNGSAAAGFTPVINDNGTISVLTGDCTKGPEDSTVWQFVPDSDNKNGTWYEENAAVDSGMSDDGVPYGSNFLSAGFLFPTSADAADTDLYVFGGMCPDNGTSEDVSTWTSSASYSDKMLLLSPASTGQSTEGEVDSWDISLSTARGGPIAEAGFTITPLTPTYSNGSSDSSEEAQNFVLIGGHTAEAFINMSQVALFALPEQSWSFISVDQPSADSQTELTRRSSSDSSTVEPRSGHTALLSPDGDHIIVLGGWVGDINTPATPQLAILELGSGYGGSGDWSWTIPSVDSSPFSDTHGIYGHGAAMLPGGIMLVMGGYSISSSSSRVKGRRSDSTDTTNNNMYLFNTTSKTWISSYTNPSNSNSSDSSKSGSSSGSHSTSQKVGLGAGVALGCSALAGLFAVYLWYSRRLRRKREAREKELYNLAINAARYDPEAQDGVKERRYPEMQSVATVKRKPVPNSYSSSQRPPVLPLPHQSRAEGEEVGSGERDAERSGLLVDIPSPTRGLRRNLHGRQPPSSTFGPVGRSGIHTIDERAEYEDSSSGKRVEPGDPSSMNPNRYSDPFKDPPPDLGPMPSSVERTPSTAKRQRMEEIQGWVDDWTAAAAAMDLSRNASMMSRSQSHSHSHSTSGRGSPEKNDRTGSNLSDASIYSTTSWQRSNIGSLKRNGSTRSVSAGYAQQLFAGAAAAMGKMYTAASGQETNDQATSSAPSHSTPGWRRSASLTMKPSHTFSSQATTMRPSTAEAAAHTESESLLRTHLDGVTNKSSSDDTFATPPESPVKERPPRMTPSYTYSSLLPSNTSTDFGPAISYHKRSALGFLGSVKRALTGTAIPTTSYSPNNNGISSVKRRVEEYESRSSSSSPTKRYNPTTIRQSPTKEMTETSSLNRPGSPRRTASAHATFWRGRKGRKGWADTPGDSENPNIPHETERPLAPDDEEAEWDVERAVQDRLVQVMFTIPKSRLRVVNAHETDKLSISDVDFEGGENPNGMDVRDLKGKGREENNALLSSRPEQSGESSQVEGQESGGIGDGNDRRLQTL